MKNLTFTFKNGDEVLCEQNVRYTLMQDYVKFKIDSSLFRIKLKDDLHLIKESEDGVFEIKFSKGKSQALYTLKEQNFTVEIKIIDLEYIFRDKNYIIKYNIESDDGNPKTISIMFDN